MGTVRLGLPDAVLTSATKDDALNFDMPRETRGEGRDALLDAASAPPAPSLHGLNPFPTSANPRSRAFRRVCQTGFRSMLRLQEKPQRCRRKIARLSGRDLTSCGPSYPRRDLSRDRRFPPIVDHRETSRELREVDANGNARNSHANRNEKISGFHTLCTSGADARRADHPHLITEKRLHNERRCLRPISSPLTGRRPIRVNQTLYSGLSVSTS